MLNSLRREIKTRIGRAIGYRRPFVSFVLIVYDMPDQAANTVRSLMAGYQRGVSPDDYEVLVIENASNNNMDPAFIKQMPGNFRYILRQETEPTPIHAINDGIRWANSGNVCVMIDGARLITPGVVRNTILGHKMVPRAIVTVPGYHLGRELQQKAVTSGYDYEHERQLMAAISWPDDGYRLFEIAVFSGSCSPGFYLPHGESNCISMPRELWRELGGYDAKFNTRGGGLVNLDMYKRACETPNTRLIMLHGEGTFHQFHGGVTTGGEDEDTRQQFIDVIQAQYESLRGQRYSNPETDPIYLGEISGPALQFIHNSSMKKMKRLGIAPEPESVSA
ncbi:MAG: glycosyltransferase family A protein [Pseudomonadota bacterium]